MSALSPKVSAELPGDEPGQAEGGTPADAELAPEGESPETSPTSVLLTAAGKGRPGRPARPAPSRKPAHDAFSREINRGIRKLAERRYEIERSTLDLALGNLGLLARWVRVAPELRDGKPLGFRLFAIAADGPFAKLGLRNGDVLIAINGLNLATPERVLEAYSKLRTAPRLSLGLLREGHELTQDYTIR
jgi:general secretion pathway protein C